MVAPLVRAGARTGRRLAAPVFVRFLIVGAGGCAVNSAALSVTYGLAHLALPVAAAISSEVAIVANYLLNDTWTFRSVGPSWTRFLKFNFVACVGLVMTAAGVWLLVDYARVEYLLANLLALTLAGGFNLGLSASWIWRRPAFRPRVEAPAEGGAWGLPAARRHPGSTRPAAPWDRPGPPPAA